MNSRTRVRHGCSLALLLFLANLLHAQLIDNTQAPNTAKAGIHKSLLEHYGA